LKKILGVLITLAIVNVMEMPIVQAQSNSTATFAKGEASIQNTQDVTLSKIDIETCFSLAKDILTKYYENIDLGKEIRVAKSVVDTKLLDQKLSDYLDKKISTKQYVVKAANAQKENYKLKFNLLSSEVTKEGVLLTIGTEASFNYVGMKTHSGFGEVSNILFVNTGTGYSMSDWYMPYDYYDDYVRGQVDSLINLVDNKSKLDSSSIAKRQVELENKITTYYSIDREFPVQLNSFDGGSPSYQAITPFATLTSLNKTAIATYAKNNKAKATPASGGSSVPYYDFSQISGNWDCTNFVSHALLAGGAIPYDTNGTGISSTGWYYRNLSNRSSSWSGVPNLYNFLVNNTKKGPAGTSTTYSTFKYNPNTGYPYAIGDILQFYLSGSYNNWRHSTIITEYYETNVDFVLGALVTGRSGQNSYNDNQKAEEIYPGDSKRVIKLTGYYK